MVYKIKKHIPESEALVERDRKVIATCQHLSSYPFVIDRARGEILTDVDGNEYIDFLSSASSLNLGSANTHINQAIKEQLEKCTQYNGGYSYNEPMISYAERLVSRYPGGVKAKVCYGNCGSDCNDAAVKFARAYTGRTKIITFINGYHGNTYCASSMTTCTPRMHAKMGPFMPEIYHFPFFGTDVSDEIAEREGTRAIEEAFQLYMPADEVAAVIIEPIQGDAGILPAHPIFMRKLYDLCQKNGILFISEEVQQGFWRTGKFFGIEHYPGIIPDGIIMGKSIGGSLTLGAFMAREEIMNSLPAPAHVFTLSGNALACAAGRAAFDYYETDEFQNILKHNSGQIVEEMAELKKKHPETVDSFRGMGMSQGILIVKKDSEGCKVPDVDGVFKIIFRAYEKGLILITLGLNVLRIQPPLNIRPEKLHEGFVILDEAITDLEEGNIPDEVLSYRHGW